MGVYDIWIGKCAPRAVYIEEPAARKVHLATPASALEVCKYVHAKRVCGTFDEALALYDDWLGDELVKASASPAIRCHLTESFIKQWGKGGPLPAQDFPHLLTALALA